ncbi:hypothetical protein DFH07DRAFT_842772 [Mycena maculata]|uniref:Oxidase ustYa n=1 Tax=Mycena maculata TaxID=230809 RepID=A0AAD7MYU8_9AGAR|nr:hypothetical protein DFH07DRAFT_842772 [Mycena maculata]
MSNGRHVLLALRLFLFVCLTVILKAGLLLSLKNYSLTGPPAAEFPRAFPVGELEHVRMFVEDTAHFQMDDDLEWDSLSPGDGLVYLGDDHQPFIPSMFHQLRCLNIIRRAVVDLEASGTNETVQPTDLGHHCVNYLRQMVLCRGDLALDRVLGKPFPNVFPDTYQCRDWSTVYHEVEKNQRMYAA